MGQYLRSTNHPEYGDCLYVTGEAIFRSLVNAGAFQEMGGSKLTTDKSSSVFTYVAIGEPTLWICKNDQIVTTRSGWELDSSSVVNPFTKKETLIHKARIDVPWSVDFTLLLFEPEIYGPDLARQLVENAGTKIGLLGNRPELRGTFGTFRVAQWQY
jgi:hypothetical protein